MNQNNNNKLNIDLNMLKIELAEDYHAQAVNYLSSHQLIDFMHCPRLYHKKRMGMIERKESQAFLVGRAAHCRILEGRDVYENEFILGGPINPKTKKPFGANTKTFKDWAAKQDKPVLSYEQVDQIENLASGVAQNDEAVDLLLYGRAEGVVRSEYCNVPSQIRIDWTHPHRGIVDFKTCDDLTWFESDARKYRYHNQLAFYQAVLAREIGEYVQVYIIAVEKKEPHRTGVWLISDDTLAKARCENEAAIRRLLSCRDIGHWPTLYEQIRVLDVA